MDVQVTKHIADDKNVKYQVALEGQVTGLAATPVGVKILLTAGDESLLKNFPRPKVFTFKLEKGNQANL
jgi:hypothetical protein